MQAQQAAQAQQVAVAAAAAASLGHGSAATAADAALMAAAATYNAQQDSMFRSPSAGSAATFLGSHGRKRALSVSPYGSDVLDINTMIRFSPNSLTSFVNASRSHSSASLASAGSYGHLSAGAISPSAASLAVAAAAAASGIPSAAGVLNPHHPLHHLMRSPILGLPHPPSGHHHPALHGSSTLSGGQTSTNATSPAFTSHYGSVLNGQTSLFHSSSISNGTISTTHNSHHHSNSSNNAKKMDGEGGGGGYSRETASNVVSSTVDELEERNKKISRGFHLSALSSGPTSQGVKGGGSSSTGHHVSVNGGNNHQQHMVASPNNNNNDDDERDEPGDVIETNCKWENCSREFATQELLVRHLKEDHIETNKKNFVCCWRECSRERKPFKAQYMLVVHMRRHTGEKPHKCTFEGCNKAYSRLENQKTHLRSHTGEKPYSCEFPGCTKAFTNASDRAKHQNRTHSNEKPYACKIPGCLKRYTDPSSLRKHVKTVHGAEAYKNKKHKGNENGPHDGGPPSNGGNTTNGNGGMGSDATASPASFSPSGGKSESHTMSPGSPPVTSPSTSSPDNGGQSTNNNQPQPPSEQMQVMTLDAPISDNSVSTTCTSNGPASHASDAVDSWGLDALTVSEEVESTSDLLTSLPPLPQPSIAIPVSMSHGEGGGGEYFESGIGRGPMSLPSPLNMKGNNSHIAGSNVGKASIKSRLKSGVKSATSWIPKVFGGSKTNSHAAGTRNNNNNPKVDIHSSGGGVKPTIPFTMDGVKGNKKDMKSSHLTRQGSTASSVTSFYSSFVSEDVSTGSYTSSSVGVTDGNSTGVGVGCVTRTVGGMTSSSCATSSSGMTRCASYDPVFLTSSSNRRTSSSSSITTSSESINHRHSHPHPNSHHLPHQQQQQLPTTKSGQASMNHKARHLSQTDNLIVQPQSVALNSGMSSEGYGSSLSTLNSTSSLPFTTGGTATSASLESVNRPDTGSGSNSTIVTVTTQIPARQNNEITNTFGNYMSNQQSINGFQHNPQPQSAAYGDNSMSVRGHNFASTGSYDFSTSNVSTNSNLQLSQNNSFHQQQHPTTSAMGQTAMNQQEKSQRYFPQTGNLVVQQQQQCQPYNGGMVSEGSSFAPSLPSVNEPLSNHVFTSRGPTTSVAPQTIKTETAQNRNVSNSSTTLPPPGTTQTSHHPQQQAVGGGSVSIDETVPDQQNLILPDDMLRYLNSIESPNFSTTQMTNHAVQNNNNTMNYFNYQQYHQQNHALSVSSMQNHLPQQLPQQQQQMSNQPPNPPHSSSHFGQNSMSQKARHLFQTSNLVVQPQSVALNTGVTPGGYGYFPPYPNNNPPPPIP